MPSAWPCPDPTKTKICDATHYYEPAYIPAQSNSQVTQPSVLHCTELELFALGSVISNRQFAYPWLDNSPSIYGAIIFWHAFKAWTARIELLTSLRLIGLSIAYHWPAAMKDSASSIPIRHCLCEGQLYVLCSTGLKYTDLTSWQLSYTMSLKTAASKSLFCHGIPRCVCPAVWGWGLGYASVETLLSDAFT